MSFAFHGFKGANLILSGLAEINPDGLLRLTNNSQEEVGHAFYPFPVSFSPTVSFSCVFVVAIVPMPKYSERFGHGITFALAPSPDLPNSDPSRFLGLLNASSSTTPVSNPNASSFQPRIVAVELDTVKNADYQDRDNNHVGIDLDNVVSIAAAPAAYYDYATASFTNFSLVDGKPIWVWVDYDGSQKRMNVTVARKGGSRPAIPLLANVPVDVPATVAAETFVGFTAATGSATASHYVLGWSFAVGGSAFQELDPSMLPKVPRSSGTGVSSSVLAVLTSIASAVMLVLVTLFARRLWLERRGRYAEELEDWEGEYGPQRFSYEDLYKATAGFRVANIVGAGGFGKVYYGTMPTSGEEVAVKRISHDSKQGTREFVAEVASMSRLRHRNLVPLLGYCRRSDELLLVYEFMHNGNLDRRLFGGSPSLDWPQRLHIVRGVAAGLLYLHEGWEQVVVHRDVKAANVLLDRDMNGRLGDFGLARLYDRGSNPQTTHVVGTLGYLAPEIAQTGKASTAADVYAFGAFLLEVVTGRRPIECSPTTLKEEFEKSHLPGPKPGQALVDWVLDCWMHDQLFLAVDRSLPASWGFQACEAEMVLRLGVLCSHPDPTARPQMKQVVGVLEGEAAEPPASPNSIKAFSAAMRRKGVFDKFSMSYSLPTNSMSISSSAITVVVPR